MKFLPFEKYKLETNLSPVEIERRLQANVQRKRLPAVFPGRMEPSKPYQGEVFADGFRIERIINYRNSFLPVISGTVETFLGNTLITVRMRPSTFVIIFISLWLGIIGLVCLGILLLVVVNAALIFRHAGSVILLVPFAMFIFGWLLTYFAFRREARIAKDFLAVTTEGEITDDSF